jgi:hypothetical protein
MRDRLVMRRGVFRALTRRGPVLAAVVAFTVFGAVSAFASTLNVGANGLSAGSAPVGSCRQSGTPITASYTAAYDSTVGGYEVTGVTVMGMDPRCDGKTVSVTLAGASNASLASGTATYDSADSNTSVVFASLSATPPVADVTGISVAIDG